MARRTIGAGGPLAVALALLIVTSPAPSQTVAGDYPCDPNPDLPADCVSRLGPIGGSVVREGEGYLNIVAPVVDPLLKLRSGNASNGLLYALAPASNDVVLLDPVDLSRKGTIRVCYRPSALAQNESGSEVYVACHASNAILVVDTASRHVVADIQDRDAQLRPVLREPMAMVSTGERLYVALSQADAIAVIDQNRRRVLRTIAVPGHDPRSLALSPDGRHLIVSNLLAGNRTEPGVEFHTGVFDAATPAGRVCAPLFDDAASFAVADEGSPSFMDRTHPNYPTIAECYFFAHTFGTSSRVVTHPGRDDHDLVVLDLQDERVVFTTDGLSRDIGTLNYGLSIDDETNRVYLASTAARNGLGHEFGNRPIVNQLAVLRLEPRDGTLKLLALRDLDAPFLNRRGRGEGRAALPYAVRAAGGRVLLAAAASDRLVVADAAGKIQRTVPVGPTPKGLVVDQETVYVYNAVGPSVSRVELAAPEASFTVGLGPSPVPQLERIGAHLFHSAALSSNGTVACASCHPDGHADGLVWELNTTDGLRSTRSLHEISQTAPYHWDGTKCNLKKIVQDTVTGLMGRSRSPDACRILALSAFIDSLVGPHSPFRAADDSMTPEARLGLALFQRARSKDARDRPRPCSGRIWDMATEPAYLAATQDPLHRIFDADGGGGPVANTRLAESCSVGQCHVSPHWESEGFFSGRPQLGLIDGYQAVSTLGAWDREVAAHDGRTTRENFLLALERNRAHHGATPYTDAVAVAAFNDAHFRHPEFNFDDDPATHGFVLTDAMTRFMMEEEQLQSGAVGLSVVLHRGNRGDPEKRALLELLEAAARRGKVALVGVGLLRGRMVSLNWPAGARAFDSGEEEGLSLPAIEAALEPGDSMLFYGALPPGQGTSPPPKLKAVTRAASPLPCAEDYAEYLADVAVGERDVTLQIHGDDVAAGTRVMVDGRPVGAALAGPGPPFDWVLSRAPGATSILALQLLGPTGLQSNSVAMNVVAPPLPPVEPGDLRARRVNASTVVLSWSDQFGVTGPGTRYDVFRGGLGRGGPGGGRCLSAALFRPTVGDDEVPGRGEAFYYLVRSQNASGRSSFGSAARDRRAADSPRPCAPLFPRP